MHARVHVPHHKLIIFGPADDSLRVQPLFEKNNQRSTCAPARDFHVTSRIPFVPQVTYTRGPATDAQIEKDVCTRLRHLLIIAETRTTFPSVTLSHVRERADPGL